MKFLKNELQYSGTVVFDKSIPDGTPRKIVDSSIAIKYGWKPKVNLPEGFRITFEEKNYGYIYL